MATAQDIENLYQSTLGRSVGKAGADYWSQKAAEGYSLDDIRKGIQNSDEYKKRAALQSQPAKAPADWNTAASKQKRFKDGQQRATSQISTGFTPKASYSDSSSNTDFLKAVYQNETGRDADQNGLAYWTNQMNNGMRRDEVIAAFNSSQEGRGYDSPMRQAQATQQSIRAPQTQITPQQTSQFQLQQMLDSNSPLMQQAATMGNQRANARGLLNSSMASQAAQGAMISAATPFAQQDAQTYFQNSQANADRQQQEYMANLNYQNQRGLNEQQYGFQRGLNEQQYGFQRGLNEQQYGFQRGLNEQGYGFEIGRIQQQLNNEIQRMGYAYELDQRNIPQNYAANISAQTLQNVQAIQADPNLEPDAKKAAIKNVIDMANANMSWAETFYNTPMPALRIPGAA